MSKARNLLVLLDLGVSVAALLLAALIRFGLEGRGIPQESVVSHARLLPLLALTQVAAYRLCGVYRQASSAHNGRPGAQRLMRAAVLDGLITVLITWFRPLPGLSRSITAITWLIKLIWLVASRLANGQITAAQIRDVQIEDLLGRPEVRNNLLTMTDFLAGETVLVTGAGGSIGSELCRQIARAGPARLLLLGHGENSIYEIDRELRERHPGLHLIPIIADVQDEARIEALFAQYHPDVIFHAAAHKHVPLMEQNPGAAIKNNILGTLNVARAADQHRAKRFVLISSDKAVNPTGVMGATKRAAELVIQALAQSSDTIYVAVRFGNVLGSRGSVIPLFKRQIAAGGPVTVTDPHMVRYFMTIPEAVQLVIRATGSGRGGEVFVLDMGGPIRIVDLARDLIRLSGFEPDRDIPIVYTGIRPGEKLFEELLTAAEGVQSTLHERIFIAPGRPPSWHDLEQVLSRLRGMAEGGRVDGQEVRSLVKSLEPSPPQGFDPQRKLPERVG